MNYEEENARLRGLLDEARLLLSATVTALDLVHDILQGKEFADVHEVADHINKALRSARLALQSGQALQKT